MHPFEGKNPQKWFVNAAFDLFCMDLVIKICVIVICIKNTLIYSVFP